MTRTVINREIIKMITCQSRGIQMGGRSNGWVIGLHGEMGEHSDEEGGRGVGWK
jgi:hypothetical protein